MQFWAKIALLSGLLMIVGPAMLRISDFIDNSIFTAFFAIGILLVIIGNNNRIPEDRKAFE